MQNVILSGEPRIPLIVQNSSKPEVKGKFIYIGDHKFYIKGVTYGTFAPDATGLQFPAITVIDTDFKLMAQNGINTVRTYTVPPLFILDLALKYDLKVMVGVPWEQHLTFLDDKITETNIINKILESIENCIGHPALLCYTIGNEIPAPIVRWYGPNKIEKFLEKLYNIIKSKDPTTLITYVNYPTTEYLKLPFLDFVCFNVYLESSIQLEKYLARLHNISLDKPLVLAEIGLDSLRNGLQKQSETLDWQLRTIFGSGCSGTFIFSWTDEWWRGGLEILDWNFGLVDRSRLPKPSLQVVSKFYKNDIIPNSEHYPFVSVVICSYNGSATIQDTLDHLLGLEYKNFEIILVNDGSTDNLLKTVSKYKIKIITIENNGLSNARNIGYLNAKGEIIAYIDDDAYPDPNWLSYLVYAFNHSNHVCIGGPNLIPQEDLWIAQCVAVAPGGPIHVLLSDEIAEHVPGCNMAIKRDVLVALNGFDPIFKAAGDDVDICWRIQELGYTIGFHPGAVVWHHRRNSIKSYWKQQMGYGKAEALLERKWPEKYNNLGHLTWSGRIYSNSGLQTFKLSKDKIFYGTWGTALFQSIYSKPSYFWTSFFKMPEWYLFISFLILLYILGYSSSLLLNVFPILILSLGIVLLQACYAGWRSIKTIKSDKNQFTLWAIISFFHIMQPMARLVGRMRYGLTPWRKRGYQVNPMKSIFFQPRVQTYWSESWKSMHDWLVIIEQNLIDEGIRVQKGGSFDEWDLEVDCGFFSSAKGLLTVEEHGQGKQFIKFKTWINFSFLGLCTIVVLLFLCLLLWIDLQIIVASLLSTITLYFVFKYINDPVHAMAGLKIAFSKLNNMVKS